METNRDCPFCNGKAILKSLVEIKEFKKEAFQIKAFFYKCEKCGEEFTTTNTDEVTINQVYNQYREKHGIPFPEELTKLREIYGLSAQKMAQIFGFGINTYSNYEKGEMPTSANAKLISSGKNPQIFLSFLEQSKDQFPAKKYQKLEAIAKSQQISIEENDTVCNFNWYSVPNKFTGYCIPNPDKVANLLLYFITECKPEYNDKLKLNKMLFYADFLNYKSTGKSISGISYRAIPYGPVPSKYDFIFAHFTEQNEIIESVFIKAEDSKINECFKSIKPFDLSIFTEEELKTIRHIIELFKNTPSWDLVELSHTEKACIELNKEREIISYQEYAFDLSLEL